MYPLANDENGIPIEVPAQAIGWLVRRHAGGRGRPGAIYDADGRPLVVEMDATARELRGRGCSGGPYRLEAVDVNRKPLGVVAFTEVADDGEAPEGRQGSARGDRDDALVRAIEAMQRVQAERERWQAEAFFKLIEKISPAPQQSQQSIRNALAEAAEVQKFARKLSTERAEKESAREPAPVVVEPAHADDTAESEDKWAIALQLAKQFGPVMIRFVLHKFLKMSPSDITMVMAGVDAAVKFAEASTGNDNVASAASSTEPAADASSGMVGMAQLSAIFARLTAEERTAVDTFLGAMPDDQRDALLDKAIEQMKGMSLDDAAAFVRKMLSGAKPARAAGGAS